MNKMLDMKYLALRQDYFEACKLLVIFADIQSRDRKWLKKVTDPNLAKIIRHRMAQRRCGKNGLRSLNKTINRFFRYCDEMGY